MAGEGLFGQREDLAAVDAQAWFVQRTTTGLPWPRSPELQPQGLHDDAGRHVDADDAWVNAVETLVAARRRLLGPRVVWAGRILVFQPGESLSDGAAQKVSGGFFDIDNTPPWDTWIGFRQGTLYAWIPRALELIVQDAINVNPEQCLKWAVEGWTLRRRADGRIEAVCKHGVGHGGIHGCDPDQCCQAPDFPKDQMEAARDRGRLGM